MVPEDPSEGAALSAPEATGEEPASAAAETCKGVVVTAEAAAPLSSWADLSERCHFLRLRLRKNLSLSQLSKFPRNFKILLQKLQRTQILLQKP